MVQTQPDVSEAIAVVRTGGVIAYPTEAVWGLGCDPYNQESVERLLQIKKRPVDKGLILIASEYEQLAGLFMGLPTELKQRLLEERERPTTWLVPDEKNEIPAWVKGSHSSVAIRLSRHPLARALCKGFGGMLISTSANEAGEKELRDEEDVSALFADQLDYILSGPLGGELQPSQIIDLQSGRILR